MQSVAKVCGGVAKVCRRGARLCRGMQGCTWEGARVCSVVQSCAEECKAVLQRPSALDCALVRQLLFATNDSLGPSRDS